MRKNGAWRYRPHDLVADPWEKMNVYTQYPDKVAELKALYDSVPP